MATRTKRSPNMNTFQGDRIQLASVPGCASECASIIEASRNGQQIVSDLGWMLPNNRERFRNQIELASKNRFNWRNNAEDYALFRQKLIESSDLANPAARAEMASYRRFELTSDLLATPFALGAFQAINLSNDELPMMVTPPSRQYFNVRWLGNDGGARQTQWTRQSSAETFEMRKLGTDKVEYSLMDIQEGDVNQAANIDAQLRFDMEWKVEGLAKDTMDAGIITSGLRDILNVHPRIDVNNIPDTNYLDLRTTNYGTQGYLTIERLKQILFQISLWSAGTSADGPFEIQSMIMSPLNRRDSWDYTDIVTGFDSVAKTWDTTVTGAGGQANPRNTVPTAMREAIFSSGNHMAAAWGFNWQNQYNTSVPRGRLYITTNKPIGWYFTKSAMDRHIVWDNEPDNIEMNQGQAMYTKVLAFVTPELWAHHFLVVDF